METILSGVGFTFAYLEDIVISSGSYGFGACILHKMPDGIKKKKKPIAHASRTLLPAEKHDSQD